MALSTGCAATHLVSLVLIVRRNARPRGAAKQVGKEVKLNEVLGIKDIPRLELPPRFRDSAKPLLYDEPLDDVKVQEYRAPTLAFFQLRNDRLSRAEAATTADARPN